jgi:ketosteroid isomerase-like protein
MPQYINNRATSPLSAQSQPLIAFYHLDFHLLRFVAMLRFQSLILLLFALAAPATLTAQILPGLAEKPAVNPLDDPSYSTGKALLFKLEADFAKAVAAGGGKAFASYFAEDGVTLANKQEATIGREAIARKAVWDPATYQLSWTPQGGQMSPSGDMGYTWGHYEGRSKDSNGNPVLTTGRYLTLWKKQADGAWKVALETSNEEPADCGCKLP